MRRELVVDFGDAEHFYVFGLAVLALWARSNGAAYISPRNLLDAGELYLDQISFFRYVQGIDSRAGNEGFNVSIQPIERGKYAEIVAGELVSICQRTQRLRQEDADALGILFAELVENVLRHAGTNCHANIGAQYYPERRKVSIVIADTGMGLLSSFRSGRNLELTGFVDHEAAIDAAMRPLVTSKPVIDGVSQGHSGYGLFVASELAIRNGGTIAITSGDCTVVRYKKKWRRRRDSYRGTPWKGTIVQILLDLNNLLDIGEVYRALPAPEGPEHDFFA